MSTQQSPDANLSNLFFNLLVKGWPFAVSLLAILSAHEFGHYFMGRHRGIDVTLPFFIPLPLSMLGTMGAFINIRSLPRNKRDLFDMSIAGPLSGFFAAVVILVIGLRFSTVGVLPNLDAAQTGIQMEGNSLLYLLLKRVVFGMWLPSPAWAGESFHLSFWLPFFFTGAPFPGSGLDVILHPVAWAGWAGLLVTALNLIPAGQLDGGHIFFCVLGREKMRRLFPYILTLLIVLGFEWFTWWVWAFILFFMGFTYTEPLDHVTDLDPIRRRIGYAMLFILFITFVPVPISLFVP